MEFQTPCEFIQNVRGEKPNFLKPKIHSKIILNLSKSLIF